MHFEINPLKQHFRRPAVYLKLPSNGDGYPKDAIIFPENNELPVYPMTALDEISAKTPDAVYNGDAIVSIIKSCIPNIKEPWHINNCDLDAVLIAIKTATNGGLLEISTTCPKCSTEAKYDVNLASMMRDIKYPKYNVEYKIDDLLFKFKPLPFVILNQVNNSQFEFQKTLMSLDNISDEKEKIKIGANLMTSMAVLSINTVSHGIEYIKTPSTVVSDKTHILDYLKNCDKNVFNHIKSTYTGLKSQSDPKPLKMKCGNCGHEYEQPFTLNFSDFFE